MVTKNIDYWGDGIRRHRLDIIARKDLDRGARAAPVMVYIHGGAWIIGDKREQGKPMLYELVARGWVCVTINYRLSPKATWPDHIVDCKRAIAWVREHIAEYGGDPSFIALSRRVGRRPPVGPGRPHRRRRRPGSRASSRPTPRSTPASRSTG